MQSNCNATTVQLDQPTGSTGCLKPQPKHHCGDDPAAATSWQNCADSRWRFGSPAAAAAPLLLVPLLALLLPLGCPAAVVPAGAGRAGLPQEALSSWATAAAVSSGSFRAASHRSTVHTQKEAFKCCGSDGCAGQVQQPPFATAGTHLSGGRRWTWGGSSRRPRRRRAAAGRRAPGEAPGPRQHPNTPSGHLQGGWGRKAGRQQGTSSAPVQCNDNRKCRQLAAVRAHPLELAHLCMPRCCCTWRGRASGAPARG
jgi:hypothetical protein